MRGRWWVNLLASVLLVTACTTPAVPPAPAPPRPTPPIRYEGGSTAATDAPQPTLRIDRPPTLSPGHVLIAQIAARNVTPVTVIPPDNWILVGQTQGSAAPPDGGVLSSWVFQRVAAESEPESYEFTATSPSAMVASLSGFSQLDPDQRIDTFAGTANASTTTLQGPDSSTNSGNAMAMWLGSQLTPEPSKPAAGDCQRPPVTPPAEFRPVGQDCTAAGAGLALGVGVRQLGAGSVQPRWSGTSTTAGANLVQVVTLRPVGSPNGDGHPPSAQAPDRFARELAPTLVGPGRFGYLLWNGTDPRRDVDLGEDVLYQPSGLAASRTNPQVLFANSEKDRATMVAVNNRDGQVLGHYTVRIPDLFDWEDVAAGPCPAGNCLYAADIGRNREIPKPTNVFSVTRFPEPDVSGGQTSGELAGDTFPFTYPDGEAVDAEAILVHPRSGDIYVLTKDEGGSSEVYAFPSPLPEPGVISELVKVATLRLPMDPKNPQAAMVTAAAAHPVANRLLIRTYRHVYEFRGPEDAPITAALAGRRVELTDPGEGQGESITYAIDGSAYYTLSEAEKPPYGLNRVDRT